MAIQNKLCIFYLTNSNRHYTFELFLKHISNSKYKDQIIVLLLINSDSEEFYKPYLDKYSIQYKIIIVPEFNNYMIKLFTGLRFAETMQIPYVMKHDDDIIMGTPMYDYLFENMNCLENEDNLLLSPSLTSGIPTVEQFTKDFLSETEQLSLSKKYLEYQFETNIWGVDYSSLNKFTVAATKWDPASYFNAIKDFNHPYKGIHPIRMYPPAIEELNTYVVKYSQKILSQPATELVVDYDSPYLCNSLFIMKTNTYLTIVNTQELYYDIFDEVPVNRWKNLYNKAFVYTKNGAAIHFVYNSYPNHHNYEQQLIQLI